MQCVFFVPMACRDSGGSKILLCLGLYLVASSLCHCARLTKLKALDKLRGGSTLSQGQVIGGELRHGRLLIGQNTLQDAKSKGAKATKNLLDVDTDYQEDMGWGEPRQPKGRSDDFSKLKQDNTAVEQLLKLEPKVECTGDSMKLQVRDAASTAGSLFFVDRGSRLSPLPLSKLPSSCGYTIKSTRRDLVLVAPYDGCFVALEEDSYVLPLRWWGLPVRMSCPLMRQSSPNPPMVTCHADGMVVKMEWTVSVAKIKISLAGSWEPLMKASPRCGFSVIVHPEGVVISVRYAPCLEKKDGMYTVELAGDGETKISCPLLSQAQPESTNGPKKQPEAPSKGVHPSIPSHNSASTHAPEPRPNTPAPAVPQVPDFPQKPEVPNKEPNQGPTDIYQPQLPYFPYPNFYYPNPANTDTKPTPTVQATPPPITKDIYVQQSQQTVPPAKLPLNPEGQVPQPLPFYLWPSQPEVEKEPPVQPPATQQPNTQEKQPFYPYPFFVKPPNTDVEPPYSLYPNNPQKPLPEHPEPPKPPVSEEPQGQIYMRYPYPSISPPFLPQDPYQPVPPAWLTPTSAPKGQVQQPLSPLQPGASKPKGPGNVSPSKPHLTPENKEPQQPEAPQGQVYQPFYPYPYHFYLQPEPEKQPVEKPTAVPKPPKHPEAPQGQVYQPFYPQPEKQPAEKPTAVPKPPQQPGAPQGQVYQPFYPQPEKQPAEKPTAVPKPPQQPETPQGQVYQPFYPYPSFYRDPYLQPNPENQPAEKPTAVPKPPQQPEAPQGQVYQPFYPQPEKQPAEKPTAVPKPPQQPEAPQGQVYQPFYPQPEKQPAEKPTAVPKPPQQPETPQGQVYQPFYPYPSFYRDPYLQPNPENQPAEKPTAVPKPPQQPEAPQGQVYQPFYPQPEKQPAEKPTAVPKPPQQPETPQGQVYQLLYPYPYPMYPLPEPGNQPAKKPTAVPKPPATETPKGQAPTEKPVQSEQRPIFKPPEGQVPHPFNPYYYPQRPQHVTLPPATSMQQQVTIPASGQTNQESAIPQQSNGGIIPQSPQLGSSPVYCPQVCPSGFSNCCLQIAFHQHLHHIVPAGNKDAPSAYPGWPFFPPAAHSGFGSAPLPQKPVEPPPTKAAPTSPQSPPSGNDKQPYQPPDGNPATLPGSNPSKPSNPEQVIYPYFVPSSLYPNWPFPPQKELQQNVPQRLPQAHYSVPFEPQAPSNEPVNPVVQYEPSNVQPPLHQNGQRSPGDTNNPSGHHLLALINELRQQNRSYQNIPTFKELQPSHKKSSEYKGITHPKVQSELDSLLVPYYMHQDAQAPTYNKSVVPYNSQPQQSVSGSKKSTRHDPTVSAYSEPKSYVLLQHGPPGREPNSFSESPLPFRDVVHDANFLAQNLARHQSSETQHLKPLQEKPQGLSNPLSGNVNYMPRSGDKLEGLPLFSAPDGPHFVPLPKDPSPSAAHLKPNFLQSFKHLWKPMTPYGSSQRVPPHVPRNAFQQWSNATDQANGLIQPIQKEGGTWNPK